jgi:hypothetical protein
MDMLWWEFSKACPECGGKMKLDKLEYGANGTLLFTFSCSCDDTTLECRKFASELQEQARRNDFEVINRPEPERKPIKPPLLLSAPVPKLTDADRTFLGYAKIDPEDGNLA